MGWTVHPVHRNPRSPNPGFARLPILQTPGQYMSAMITLVASFLLLVVGITLTAPPLKNIYWKAELKQRSIDGFDSKMGFINLNSRATKLRSSS
ncbi:hypothetical protein PCASD_10057 [Puccinia coronata f. sp. avenae]|uniref:Uncharacterized protein n=1 Tax=Puccinia coronata f. sp. avenae TaxID=200324 RepID=A0A2N5UJP4_9BASI|nr:hypothetical protein PCASD_10057 [Puccinia coronata f. sp. avenae]